MPKTPTKEVKIIFIIFKKVKNYILKVLFTKSQLIYVFSKKLKVQSVLYGWL